MLVYSLVGRDPIGGCNLRLLNPNGSSPQFLKAPHVMWGFFSFVTYSFFHERDGLGDRSRRGKSVVMPLPPPLAPPQGNSLRSLDRLPCKRTPSPLCSPDNYSAALRARDAPGASP